MPRTRGTRVGNGAGKGDGWGGPPKGVGAGPAKPFGAGNPGMTPAESREARGDAPSKHATRKALEEARAEELRDHLYALAMGAERQETQLSAAVAYLNRVEGMPTQRQQVEVKRPIEEMTEAELASAIELVRAAVAGVAEGAGSGIDEAGHGKPH